MARNPNSLPDDKGEYIRGLVLRRHVTRGLHVNAAGIALVMYHSEVPYHLAEQYMRRLAGSQYLGTHSAFVEGFPDTQLRAMFRQAGASDAEIDQYLATLNPKRAHLLPA